MDSVAELHELERLDKELATASSEFRALEATIARIRERAEAIDSFFASHGASEKQRRAAVADAERQLAMRRDELAAAEGDDEDRELQEKALARARDHIGVAESRLERASADQDQLEAKATELPFELQRLEAEAYELAAAHPGLPVPTQDLTEWASHAHAELFVALSQLDARRERIIREANELATAILGEPTFGSTIAQARRRVEART